MVVAAAWGKPSGAVLRGEVSGEEAGIVWGASCTEGAGGAQISKHTGLIAVVSHPAPVAAVAGETPATAAHGGAQDSRTVRGEVEAAVVQVTWKQSPC